MKRSVSELLDGMTAAELDEFDSLPVVQTDAGQRERIAALAAESAGIKQHGSRRATRRFLLVAACIVLLACVLVGCYVIDETQYSRAAEFFDLNHLSTDGLSRSEIKRVWRDITTESLTFDKTAEVLRNSAAADLQRIEGLNITVHNRTNSTNGIPNGMIYDLSSGRYLDISESLSVGHTAVRFTSPDEGLYYVLNCEEGDESCWYRSASVEKYMDGELLWRTALGQGFYPQGYLDMGDWICVSGHNGGRNGSYGCAAAVDTSSGEVLWEKSPFGWDYGFSPALTPEGNAAFFTLEKRLGKSKLSFCVFDRSGRVIARREWDAPAGMLHISKAVAIDDGYLVRTWYSDDWEVSGSRSRLRLMKLSAAGEPQQTVRYGDDQHTYDFADMLVRDGVVYLSATARPVDSQLYREIDEAYRDADGTYGSYTEEWRDRAQEEFSAVLFVVDFASGDPERFFSVGGAFAGELGTDEEGKLTWNTERILTCGYSPATSAFSLYGNTRCYIYAFDRESNTLRQERTDRIGGFHTR